MALFSTQKNRLMFRYDAETLVVEPWGKDSLRIRATKQMQMPQNDWALLEQEDTGADLSLIHI